VVDALGLPAVRIDGPQARIDSIRALIAKARVSGLFEIGDKAIDACWNPLGLEVETAGC
jgi:hypothetical protein